MSLAPVPDPSPEDDESLDETYELDSAGGRMSFLEHLDELRRRLIISVAALLAGFLIAFGFISPIFDFIMRPLQEILPDGGRLVYTEPAEAFLLYIKIAALAGLMLAIPVVLYQLWCFVAPGLYSREKRFAIPFVLRGSIGSLFGHVCFQNPSWTRRWKGSLHLCVGPPGNFRRASSGPCRNPQKQPNGFGHLPPTTRARSTPSTAHSTEARPAAGAPEYPVFQSPGRGLGDEPGGSLATVQSGTAPSTAADPTGWAAAPRSRFG